LDWPSANGTPAALPPRGRHHYAALGVADGNGGYAECCCRFDSLCALLRASSAAAPGTSVNHLAATPAVATAGSAAAESAKPKPKRTRAKKTAKPD
ncbi:MAG: DUF6519 domain-containing protein, partial [Rhodanobacter sp.]